MVVAPGASLRGCGAGGVRDVGMGTWWWHRGCDHGDVALVGRWHGGCDRGGHGGDVGAPCPALPEPIRGDAAPWGCATPPWGHPHPPNPAALPGGGGSPPAPHEGPHRLLLALGGGHPRADRAGEPPPSPMGTPPGCRSASHCTAPCRCTRSSSRTWRTSAPKRCCGGLQRAKGRGGSAQVRRGLGGGARSQGGGGGQLCMGTLLPSWLTPRLLSGTLDFEEYRLAPAQEGEYVCPPLSPVLGGALGGAAHCFVPPPLRPHPRAQEEPQQSLPYPRAEPQGEGA